MENYLKLEITARDLKNIDSVLKKLKEQNPELDFEVEISDEDEPPLHS